MQNGDCLQHHAFIVMLRFALKCGDICGQVGAENLSAGGKNRYSVFTRKARSKARSWRNNLFSSCEVNSWRPSSCLAGKACISNAWHPAGFANSYRYAQERARASNVAAPNSQQPQPSFPYNFCVGSFDNYFIS